MLGLGGLWRAALLKLSSLSHRELRDQMQTNPVLNNLAEVTFFTKRPNSFCGRDPEALASHNFGFRIARDLFPRQAL